MKKQLRFISLLLICLLAATVTFAQGPTFTFNILPNQLVNTYLLGSSVTATNITGIYTPISAGAFANAGSSGIGLTSGIALSTGHLDSVTANPATFNSTGLGTPGDLHLGAIVTPLPTYDAQVIEFDFKATSDSIEFDFVFASEEYNDFVNTNFNDLFGFFVTGPGYANNTNVALIPGTAIPISINNVNNGGPFGGIATGPCTNCAYYVDNVVGPVQISYDGLTTVIKIKFAVWPCTDYHFKIAIADVADGSYDSAVLIGENSFIGCPIVQVANNGIAVPNTLSICAGGSLTLTAPNGPNYSWNNGATTQSITVTQPGIYQCTYSDAQGNCATQTAVVNLIQQGSIQTPVISQQGTTFVSNIIPSPGITYQWFLDGNPIAGATNATYSFQLPGCYSLIIYEGTCESMSNIECITTSVHAISTFGISIIPHPVINQSVIENDFPVGSVTTLNLYDLSGKLVQSQISPGGSDLILDKSILESGIYFIELSNSLSPELIKGKVVLL